MGSACWKEKQLGEAGHPFPESLWPRIRHTHTEPCGHHSFFGQELSWLDEDEVHAGHSRPAGVDRAVLPLALEEDGQGAGRPGLQAETPQIIGEKAGATVCEGAGELIPQGSQPENVRGRTLMQENRISAELLRSRPSRLPRRQIPAMTFLNVELFPKKEHPVALSMLRACEIFLPFNFSLFFS